ncbi:DDHD domain-containing protein, partial [Neohortaea acidophila]
MAAQDSSAASYLSRLSPWPRIPVVQPGQAPDVEPSQQPLPKPQKPVVVDHVVNHRHRSSVRKYPRDCPPLRPMWFHAVDSPKRRPNPAGKMKKEPKPLPAPKKYTPFSVRDSKAIEAAYRKLAEERGSEEIQEKEGSHGDVRVPVNEDYLFDVDVEQRELGPAYWLGPVYDVRRGTWFIQDGSIQKPCDENLAEQLEDGYLKVKAWRLPTIQTPSKARSSSQPRSRPTSWTSGLLPPGTQPPTSDPIAPKGSSPDLRKQAVEHAQQPIHLGEGLSTEEDTPLNTYRLFGAHMNSIVTYQDATTAWLLSDDFMSRMNFTMYERFAGGGHFGGVRLTRGYADASKKPEAKDGKLAEANPNPMLDSQRASTEDELMASKDSQEQPTAGETRRQRLERHMSSLLEDTSSEDREKQEEEVRKRDEREMEEDYREQAGEEQGREIEHLILVTHGIGQRLGLRLESVNFVHDVNTFRKTIKAVYADSPDLRALNAELDKADVVNSRIQVLPICWRHLLDFPKQSLKHNRGEHDLADTEFDDDQYPSLEDITVEGVPAVRNLITDLALDILLYQSPAYKDYISRIVLRECNRIYHLFMDRNPDFKGKISLVGHSLGSAIMFDLLCQQQKQPHQSRRQKKEHGQEGFHFEVEDFYALGSPIGLFQMLKGGTIAARESADRRSRAYTTSMDDPMLGAAALPNKKMHTPPDIPTSHLALSSPKCGQIFNIFHPTDPISYRIEPLISPSMSSLKPQPLPYTKRGIFGAPMGQGLTGIGARVTQSVSSMWTNVASNLLTRGLGYPGGEQAAANAPQSAKSSGPLAMSTDANAKSTNTPKASLPAEGAHIEMDRRQADDPSATGESGQHPPTLIDAELETLYAGFQTRRKSGQSDASSRDFGAGLEWQGAEERARRLRREEEKVRRLNSNGRVDYAIQEGVFDINLIAAIASHLTYWSDEDVNHFIISQLLSRSRVVRP